MSQVPGRESPGFGRSKLHRRAPQLSQRARTLINLERTPFGEIETFATSVMSRSARAGERRAPFTLRAWTSA
jgi:hypothetical protein